MELCTEYKTAKKKLDNIVAEKLMSTINFIENADSLLDVANYLPFHFHELKGKRKGTYAIDLGRKSGYRVILEPQSKDGETIKDEKGFYQYQRIKIVQILEVSNHYE
jgi:proteic killer suppression protein